MWKVGFFRDGLCKDLAHVETAKDYIKGDTKGFRRDSELEKFDPITVPTPAWIREERYLYIVVWRWGKAAHQQHLADYFWEHWASDPDKFVVLVPKKENSFKFINDH